MLVIYLVAINLIGFIAMALDKRYAMRFEKRIPEKNLIFMACAGGAGGVLLAMKFFRHKTRHAKFYAGVPLILVGQLIIYFLYLIWSCDG